MRRRVFRRWEGWRPGQARFLPLVSTVCGWCAVCLVNWLYQHVVCQALLKLISTKGNWVAGKEGNGLAGRQRPETSREPSHNKDQTPRRDMNPVSLLLPSLGSHQTSHVAEDSLGPLILLTPAPNQFHQFFLGLSHLRTSSLGCSSADYTQPRGALPLSPTPHHHKANLQT